MKDPPDHSLLANNFLALRLLSMPGKFLSESNIHVNFKKTNRAGVRVSANAPTLNSRSYRPQMSSGLVSNLVLCSLSVGFISSDAG